VYLSTSVEDVTMTVNKFAACIADINAWLSACRLRLNAAKTQLLWLGWSQLLDKVDCHDPDARHSRRYLGHRWRSRCCHRPWAVAGSPCHGHLSRRVQSATPAHTCSRPLSVNATKMLVQAFISCRLDYCNSLLYHGISDGLLQRLQLAQNAAARLVTGARRMWPHHTSVAAAALAASSSASRV